MAVDDRVPRPADPRRGVGVRRRDALTMPASCGPAVGSAAMEIDWHADRSALEDLVTLDQLEAGEPIDLVAVRAYRLGRGRGPVGAAPPGAGLLVGPGENPHAARAR